MSEVLAAVIMLIGAAFGLVAAIGLLRMPDLPMRLHATSKAGTLGAGLVLTGVAVFHADLGVTTRAIVTVLFLILTAPVAAHVIARAAYFSGWITLWDRTDPDELQGRYDQQAHELDSAPDAERVAAHNREVDAERLRERAEREAQRAKPKRRRT